MTVALLKDMQRTMQGSFGRRASVGICALFLTFASDSHGQCVIGGPTPGAAFDDGWGAAVAISADGLTAIVGMPADAAWTSALNAVSTIFNLFSERSAEKC